MQCGVSLIKFTDKALLRKLVENEGVFLRFDVDVFFRLQFFVVINHAWHFHGESKLCCLQFHNAFFVVGLMMKPA